MNFKGTDQAKKPALTTAIALAGALALAGCMEGTEGSSGLFAPKAETEGTADTQTTKLVEREVEAPEIFSVTEAGLWDGRPSLGGVWVAHPDAKDPGQVIIRNNANGKFVIGALFRREREVPGPRIQVSSDAAAAIGMLAGQPSELNVTWLIREQVAVEEPKPETTAVAAEAETEVATEALAPVAAAEAAIAKAETETAKPEPAAAKPASASKLEKPYVQIGIFSVKSNAENTANQIKKAGLIPIIKEGKSNGKAFWRVIVGPASSTSERTSILKKAKGVGFTDAYAVTH